jgi:parallel beta-helix repeat protein
VLGATLVGWPDPALEAVQAHGILVKASHQVTVRACRVIGMRHDGIYVGGGPDMPSRRVTITETTCEGAGRNGLRIAHGRDVLVEGCTFLHTGGIPEQAGADIEPETGNSNEDIRFIGNRCSENGTTGLTVSSRPSQTGVVVSGNTFEQNGTHGVNCGGSGVVLHSNVLRANAGSGLKMSATDLTITGNTFADNGHFGINVGGEAHHCLVIGNRFTGNPDGATDGEFDPTTLIADNAGMSA